MNLQSAELDEAWGRITWNGEEVRRSTMCVCLACERYFPPSRVNWRAPKTLSEGLSSAPLREMTARCPYCNQAAVLGDASGFPIQDRGFIAAMADLVVRMKYAYD
jgi:hypothetical protein